MPKALKSCSHPLLTFADSCAIHVKPGLAVGEAKATYSSFHGLVRLQHVLWRPALQAMRGPRADAGAAGWVATCAQREVRATALGTAFSERGTRPNNPAKLGIWT